jgi:hypothetical protein
MKKLLTFSLLTIIVAGNIFAQGQRRKVLVIGIDGTRSDALQQANTPNLDSLAINGFHSYDSWQIDITVSGPSWSSIMCT